MTNRIYIKVKFENPIYDFSTSFNAPLETATKYYVGQSFNMGIDSDNMQKCVAIEEIDQMKDLFDCI